MAVSVAAVMRHCRNFFEVGHVDGNIAISGNAITPVPGSPWCYITGSWFHDGAWMTDGGHIENLPSNLPDEEFTGRVWTLNPPRDFLDLCEAISAYDDKNPTGALLQESFGNYSYMRNQAIAGQSWQMAFREQLAPYRRVFSEVG